MKHTIVQDPDGEPIGVEIIASALVDMADAMKKINGSRLKRSALVTLLCHQSKLPRGTVEVVLNNLDAIEANFLKSAPIDAKAKK